MSPYSLPVSNLRPRRSLVMLSLLTAAACSTSSSTGGSGSGGTATGGSGSGGATTTIPPGTGGNGSNVTGSGGSSAGQTGGSTVPPGSGGAAVATGGTGTGGLAEGTGGMTGTGGASTGSGGSVPTGGRGGSVSTGGRGGSVSTGTDAGAPGGEMPPPGDSGVVDPGTAGDGDFTITTVTTQPDLTDRGMPKGKRFQFTMDSTKSVIFDGRDSTVMASKRHLTRQVTVYVPAQYKDGARAPIMVMQDGPPSAGGWGDTAPFDAVNRALDNLTISTNPARKIPAFIAIAVENGGSDAQGSERGLEYDSMSDRYARFVQMEVLPAVLSNTAIKAAYPNIAITDDPEGKATYGCSSGAAASFTMAWFRPDLFRRAVTYSGTFVAQQSNGQPEAAMYPLGAWEYHSSLSLIANTNPRKPVRVHLNVNEMDNGATAAESGHHNWVIANQRMAAAMKTQGYHYRFNFVRGLGHCDYNAWRATLADTLIWLWSGYPTN